MKTQLIVALDVDSFKKAKRFVDKLYPRVRIFKVGSQLFTASGPKAVAYIRKKGADVFLDLKFYDIPNTVAQSVRQAVRLGVRMLTVHIAGGLKMLKAAVKAAREEALCLKQKKPLLIGVTILTSHKASRKNVLKLAKIGLDCGLDGVVCSAQEAPLLREKIKKTFVIVTPGIRSDRALGDDQKRTATAREAIQAGSDFLVVGRPLLKSQEPLKVAKELLESCGKLRRGL